MLQEKSIMKGFFKTQRATNDGCKRGQFYTNSPSGSTFLLTRLEQIIEMVKTGMCNFRFKLNLNSCYPLKFSKIEVQ